MKLVRFELVSDAAHEKSGFIHMGRVYETDGENPIAVHDASDVRLLPPVLPPTIRLFDAEAGRSAGAAGSVLDPVPFVYSNPYSLHGPNSDMRIPDFATQIGVRLYFAGVCHQGSRISLTDADDVLIGWSLILSIFDRSERKKGWSARSFDFGLAFGPALTTPEELEGSVIGDAAGIQYSIPYVIRANGVEAARGSSESLPLTMAQAIEAASESSPIRSGDLIGISPFSEDAPVTASIGDEISVSAESLGTLHVRLRAEELNQS